MINETRTNQTLDPAGAIRLLSADVSARVSGWRAICEWSDLEVEWGEAALVGKLQLAIFRLWDSQLHVVSNVDPANGACVMSRGIVGTRSDRPTIASPLLKQVYDLGTGECYSDPTLRLPVYPSRIVHNQVLVGLTPIAVD